MLVGYARVSTKDQNLELQIDALQQAGCSRIFEEKITGTRGDRPQLLAAFETMQPGDTLIVWKLSRLGRSAKQQLGTLQWLIDEGMSFKSLNEAIDISTATGRFMFQMLACLAELEAANGRENTRAGIAAYRARGNAWGPRLRMDDGMVAKARLLLATERQSVRQVCQELRVSKSTLYRNLGKAA